MVVRVGGGTGEGDVDVNPGTMSHAPSIIDFSSTEIKVI
jgi:hypothetical protein